MTPNPFFATIENVRKRNALYQMASGRKRNGKTLKKTVRTKTMAAETLKVGDTVTVIRPWMPDDFPTEANFHVGRITNLVYTTLLSGTKQLRYRVEGLNHLVFPERLWKTEVA